MSISLNFSKEEMEKIKELFSHFEVLTTTNQYEEERWSVYSSKVVLYNTGKLVIQGKDEELVKEFIFHKFKDFNPGKGDLVLGIDETGRGEDNGMFVISAVLGEKGNLREIRDSKKTSNISSKKEIVLQNTFGQAIVSISPELIDMLRKQGITMDEIQQNSANAMHSLFESLLGDKFTTLMDGKTNQYANKKIQFQIKADDLNPVVGAASILSKSFREESGNTKKRKTWKNVIS